MRDMYIALRDPAKTVTVLPSDGRVPCDTSALLKAVDDLAWGWSRTDLKQKRHARLYAGYTSETVEYQPLDFDNTNWRALAELFLLRVASGLIR